MCGIAGELRFRTNQSACADWDAISSMMSRRGPDDRGFWSGDEHCTLVFRRLAIIDLSPRGHQPMTAGNGRYTLVFNGEVYNFMDLRKQLEHRGVTFRSLSDSEVVLYALIEWGTEALAKFNGMFALGLYDSVEKQLLLARDYAGMKPLYYLLCNDGIVFGSQYDQLLAHPWSADFKVSEEALGLYLRLGYIPAPWALKENTHLLEPGMWLEVSAEGHCRRGHFYMFPQYAEPSLKGEEALEAVDEAISAAVKRHLISDVPVGAFLSGGIDSPLVVAKMRSASSKVIETFTIGTGEKHTDETADARAYAREIGVEHTVGYISRDQVLDLTADVIDACGEPFGDYSVFPTLMVSRLARREHKVVLSGDGGDELFWGYPSRFGRLIQLTQDLRSPLWVRRLQWGMKRVLSRVDDRCLLMDSIGNGHRVMHARFPEALLKTLFPSLPAWPSGCHAYAYEGCDPDQIAQISRWHELVYHLTMVLMKVDRASMYNSLEVRVPLLDRQVIDVASKIDWHDCLHVGQKLGKLPLRYTLARMVKYKTLGKRGFEVPMAAWLRTSLKEMFEEHVLKRTDILGLEINRRDLRTVFESHVNGRYNYARGLWPLLSLALWEKRYFTRPQVRIH
ncbi:asparagine synthase (glutamine-hydrolyzing) [Nitrospira sp. BLG_1]|uniref:asparagine synthase (glutamine-hydrolyzing) n=1 Tax=Nitrospira sp. BLG_1 TaxID=3395883 RepID=UPI0039BD6538